MDDDTATTEEYHYRHIEGFPCDTADRLENAIARMLTAQDMQRDAWLEIGAVALQLRREARMRDTARRRQLAQARERKANRPDAGTSERLAG